MPKYSQVQSHRRRKLSVALIYPATLPVRLYGGTERLVWWMARGLSEAGCDVTLVANPGSQCPYAQRCLDYQENAEALEKQLPDVDVFHYFLTPTPTPTRPYVVTIGGNGQLGETFLPNTVFISRNHAQRHQASYFIYNGIDPDDYVYQAKKESHLLFLAKATWRVKNVGGAIRIAGKSGHPIRIVGGKKQWLRHRSHVSWEGMLGGQAKAQVIASAFGLLFPVEWNEPFGLAVAEALMSGTPVLGSRRGSLPELLCDDVGSICNSETEFIEQVSRLPSLSPQRCRDWAMDRFHYRKMTEGYLDAYEKVLEGASLNPSPPQATEPPQHRLALRH